MRKAINENLLHNVFIHPYTNNVEKVLSNASIYILSSTHEGFPLVSLEAMASGLPCIAYDCPYGPGEIICDGEDGYLIDNINPKAMIDKVMYLIEHEDIRKEMGRKARKNSMNSFDTNQIMSKWIDLFEKL